MYILFLPIIIIMGLNAFSSEKNQYVFDSVKFIKQGGHELRYDTIYNEEEIAEAIHQKPFYCKEQPKRSEDYISFDLEEGIHPVDEKLVLAGKKVIAAKEVHISAPIYTNGHLLIIEAHKLVFLEGGSVNGYENSNKLDGVSGNNSEILTYNKEFIDGINTILNKCHIIYGKNYSLVESKIKENANLTNKAMTWWSSKIPIKDRYLTVKPIEEIYPKFKLVGETWDDFGHVAYPKKGKSVSRADCDYALMLAYTKPRGAKVFPSGKDGADGCAGNQQPMPIIISADQVYGEPVVIGNGENGGKGGNGGMGHNGTRGAQGQRAHASCSGKSWNGGTGGPGTMGTSGGHGGHGGQAGAAVPVMFNYGWTEQRVSKYIVSKEGAPGEGGVSGKNGNPGLGGPGGGDHRSGRCITKSRYRGGGAAGVSGPINTYEPKSGRQGKVSDAVNLLPDALIEFVNRKYKEKVAAEGNSKKVYRYNKSINLGLDEYIYR